MLLTHGQPIQGSCAEMHPPSPPQPSESSTTLLGRVSDGGSLDLVGRKSVRREADTRLGTQMNQNQPLPQGSFN